MKTIVALLHQLPLQPSDLANDMDDLSQLRTRLYNKYFQFFINQMKRLRVEVLQ